MTHKNFLLFVLLLIGGNVCSSTLDIDYVQSGITFSGSNKGTVFTGNFTRWQAEISLVEGGTPATISASFDMLSAKTGDPMIDSALPGAAWFNSREFGKAFFLSSSISKLDDNSHLVEGQLNLRGRSLPITFTLTFVRDVQDEGFITLHSTFVVDRLAFGIGESVDATGDTISRNIHVGLNIIARSLREVK